jgi:hypothetical protein
MRYRVARISSHGTTTTITATTTHVTVTHHGQFEINEKTARQMSPSPISTHISALA